MQFTVGKAADSLLWTPESTTTSTVLAELIQMEQEMLRSIGESQEDLKGQSKAVPNDSATARAIRLRSS